MRSPGDLPDWPGEYRDWKDSQPAPMPPGWHLECPECQFEGGTHEGGCAGTAIPVRTVPKAPENVRGPVHYVHDTERAGGKEATGGS